MKLAILISTLLVLPAPAFSQQTTVFDECKRYIHKEQYLPGYYDNQGNYRSGRIKRYKERVPCNNSGGYQTIQSQRQQRVGCNRGSRVLSGLLGGGIAAAVSKSDAYAWSIPIGVIAGVASDRAGCS